MISATRSLCSIAVLDRERLASQPGSGMISAMRAPGRGLLGSVSAVGDDPGAVIRAARLDAAFTVDQFASLVVQTRRRLGMAEVQHESVRRQLIGFESGDHRPGKQWRTLIAAALRTSEERLFGLDVSAVLPRPLLIDTHVTDATVQNLLNQRAVYAETEHIFGPLHVHHQVARDMQVVLDLITTTPARLRRDMRLAAASFAELLGWLAQDSGNAPQALHHTAEALAHLDLLNGSNPGIRAMLMMRRSNILTGTDPQTAAEYAEAAAQIASTLPSGRLHASIARQQALAALATGEERAFGEHVAYALDLAQAERSPNDLAAYATTAYVASEAATGLIELGRADQAAESLAEHLDHWPDGQQRDRTIAQLRHLRALTVTGDYTAALSHVDDALRAWRATPSARARHELSLLAAVLRDRSRGRAPLPLNQLRGRIKDALQGDPAHE